MTIYWSIMFFVFGACVGSFLNVVVYRLPEGESLVHPPSHCPKCGNGLKMWHNVPVLAWFYLGGKCAYCKTPISFQYPLIEAITGLLFTGLYLIYYHSNLVAEFAAAGFEQSWPILVLHMILVAALLAATLIDARLFIIPIQIPWFVTAVTMITLPLIAWRFPYGTEQVAYLVKAGGVRVALGGTIGLFIACTLLYFRLLPQSFADAYDWEVQRVKEWRQEMKAAWEARQAQKAAEAAEQTEQVTTLPENAQPPEGDADGQASTEQATALPTDATTPVELPVSGDDQPTPDFDNMEPPTDVFLGYPHARREVLKELGFIMFPIIGMAIGHYLVPLSGDGGPLWLRVLAASVFGYFVGGGVVWLTRIFGTLGFRKEAMGLGDVHLMAAVGAVLGPILPMVAFFVAPFFGLAAVLVAFGVARIVNREARIIPYGPYLACATLVVMLFEDKLPLPF